MAVFCDEVDHSHAGIEPAPKKKAARDVIQPEPACEQEADGKEGQAV